jgi:DNA helicase II / ATP-dependent DNA helicase PcrA
VRVDVSVLLDDLDDDQRRAVCTESSLVAVIAGAGSGKTRVLTRRVAYRVATGTADARHTLALTFTREAAGELRRRLPRLGLHERVEAGTFHAVMLGLLRQRWSDRNRPVPTVVSDRWRLVADGSGRAGLAEIVAEIEWAAARGIGPERYTVEARRFGRRPSTGHVAVTRAYEQYRLTKRQRGVIDLDDVLTLAVEALEHDQEFASALQWRYRHLLVDEAQDLNPLQHRIVELLRRTTDDLFIVGDPAQAVYGFNGADPTLLVEVADRFPGIEIVRLPVNHRSTPQVVDAGLHVLRRATDAVPMDGPPPRSGCADGPQVRCQPCDDETAEARAVADTIRWLEPALVRTGDVAVLARTHTQLATIRAALDAAGILVRRRLDGPGSTYGDVVSDAARQGSAARLRAWAHDLLDSSPTGRRDTPASDEAREVAVAVLDFLREQPLGDSAGLRSWIATTDPFGLRGDRGVDLLTFHASKGREWHTVIVTGVETGLVPHRSATTGADKAEEARLLYVALTRARTQLVVTWAERRGGYRRRVSPLMAGFAPTDPETLPPPREVLASVDGGDEQRQARDTLERLVGWRANAARAAGVLPEHLLSDHAMRTIADRRPANAEQLAAATGIGRLTAARLFPGVDQALQEPRQERRSSTTGA